MTLLQKALRASSNQGLRRLTALSCQLRRRPSFETPFVQCYANYLVERALGHLPRPEVDLVFALPSASRGWILEAICHRLAEHLQGSWRFADDLTKLPPARAYFFPHYSLLSPALASNPHLWGARRIVFFTHPSPSYDKPEVWYALKRATRIISMCSLHRQYLIDLGLLARRITTVVGAADPDVFKPHVRGQGAVGLCMAYYERKEPERILEIVRAMPQRRFLLMGKRWTEWNGFDELRRQPNFTYVERPFEEYPRFYDEIDVFVSPARLEGGPIPLLEAMMSNVVPVASRTGFAPDVIQPGQNGLLFDVDDDVPTIRGLIEQAYELNGNIRETVRHLTWERFAGQVLRYA